MSASHQPAVESKADLAVGDLRRLLGMCDEVGAGEGDRLHVRVTIGGHVRRMWVDVERPDDPAAVWGSSANTTGPASLAPGIADVPPELIP